MFAAAASSLALLPFLLFPLALAFPKEGIEQQVYDNLVRYTKYSSAVYQKLCPRPLGNTLVTQVRALSHLRNHNNSCKRAVLVFWDPDPHQRLFCSR